MRLTPHEIAAIKAAAAEAFGADAVVRLFGSRVHDHLKGGDIDLHVEVDALEDRWRAQGRFLDTFYDRVEPIRTDLVVTMRGKPLSAIERIAYRDGIVL